MPKTMVAATFTTNNNPVFVEVIVLQSPVAPPIEELYLVFLFPNSLALTQMIMIIIMANIVMSRAMLRRERSIRSWSFQTPLLILVGWTSAVGYSWVKLRCMYWDGGLPRTLFRPFTHAALSLYCKPLLCNDDEVLVLRFSVLSWCSVYSCSQAVWLELGKVNGSCCRTRSSVELLILQASPKYSEMSCNSCRLGRLS